MALESERNAREKEASAILAEQEKLRANLLRTISHDLRTPLTSISGNADNLLANDEAFDAETRRQIYTDIREDSEWLMNSMESALAWASMILSKGSLWGGLSSCRWRVSSATTCRSSTGSFLKPACSQ
ncbi:MAG: hypothetical protein IKA80_11245 [Spirochaetaceae bacterium]|nr:hypothetical protein [Spirochaetaceae bacterium]